MRTSLEIQNLKCGGCGTTITGKLTALKDVGGLVVNLDERTVSFDHSAVATVADVKRVLTKLGYPPEDEKNTFRRKTRSYISCMAGKIGV